MAAPPYITPEEIRNYTGAQPRWFDLEDDAAMLATLTEWTSHAEDLVTRFIGAQYDSQAAESDMAARPRLIASAAPFGVKNAVLRITANMVAQAKLRRSTVVLQLDEYTQRLVDDRIFTRAVKDDLSMYQYQEPNLGGSRAAGGSIAVSGMIARERHRTEPETFGNWERDLRLTSRKADVLNYWYGEAVPDVTGQVLERRV